MARAENFNINNENNLMVCDLSKDQELFFNEHVNTYSLSNPFYDLYNEAVDKGYVYPDINGQIVVTEGVNQLATVNIVEEFRMDMNLINILINVGLCRLDSYTYEIIFTPEEYLNNPNSPAISSEMLSSLSIQVRPNAQEPIEGNPPTYINLGTLVHDNYTFIKNTYNDVAKYDPGQAWPATVGIWVSLVKSGGAWDYKVQPGYAPWNKTFNAHFGLNNSKYRVVTSEFIGNYNYGYTGRFLFSLSILKAGSFAPSGFDELDALDHPAIEEGYNDAGAIE